MKQAGKHAGLIAELLNTREGRHFVSEAVPEIIALWSGNKKLRKLAAGPAARSIKKSFSPKAPGAGSLQELTIDRDFLSRLKKGLSTAKASGADITTGLLQGLSTLPPEELMKWGDLLLKRAPQGEGFMTLTAKIINSVHEKNPRYLADLTEEELKAVFERNDFGEIAEASSALLQSLSAAGESAGEIMWQYPAKAISLLSLVPEFVNTVMKLLLFQLRPLNSIAPDLLTNVIESLLKEVDASTAGAILSEGAELIRKIDTGSALLGEPGKPALPPLMEQNLKDFMKAVDTDVLIYALKAWTRAKSEIKSAAAQSISDDPSLAQYRAESQFRKAEEKLKGADDYLNLLEIFFERGSNLTSSHMPDPATAADLVNRGAALINDTPEQTREAAGDFISQFFDSLDGPEISRAAESIISSLVTSLKPVAPEIFPPVIRGIAELLRPDPEKPSDEMNEALSLLRDTLAGREVRS